MTEKKKNGSGGKTRREFLKDAGLLVGGTAIGSTILLAACGGGETETVTNTVTNTATVTSTAPGGTQTVTSTTTVGAGQTATETETVTTTQTTSRFICPIDGMEFDTLAELQAHFEAVHGGVAITGLTTLNVNDTEYVLANLKPSWSLAWVIRERLGLFGTKTGCNRGECGTCTVIMNGKSVYSCLILAVDSDGAEITTIEGLSDSQNFTGIQKAIWDTDALQCGFCAPGFIMCAQDLLNKNSNPTRDEVREALSGHICTCGNTNQYVEAVLEA